MQEEEAHNRSAFDVDDVDVEDSPLNEDTGVDSVVAGVHLEEVVALANRSLRHATLRLSFPKAISNMKER